MKKHNSAENADGAGEILRAIPSMHQLLECPEATELAAQYGRTRLKAAMQAAVDELRRDMLDGCRDDIQATDATAHILETARQKFLARCAGPNIVPAVNAAGIVLHTALGRSVWPESVTDSLAADLTGYVTLAADRRSGKRSERDNRLDDILTELTGAEAAAVVNNNAGATLLVLAALAAGREVVISRGQLIEIGGAFRLPDVMAAAGVTMVEVGTTNRTHKRDYNNAINENTSLLMRAHPSNFRVVGFSGEVTTSELAEIAGQARRERGFDIGVVDDLGAGALVDMEKFNLPHEPTVSESLAAGADVCLFSGDKLIGASQAGIIVGRTEMIAKIRKHPLHRALRADKTCLMALERTLELFARDDLELLKREHPLYRMLSLDTGLLQERAAQLAGMIRAAAGNTVECEVVEVEDYPGGGSMPTEAMAGRAVRLKSKDIPAHELAEALRMDTACIFSRVADKAVWLHLRTIFPHQMEAVAAAVGRVVNNRSGGC